MSAFPAVDGSGDLIIPRQEFVDPVDLVFSDVGEDMAQPRDHHPLSDPDVMVVHRQSLL